MTAAVLSQIHYRFQDDGTDNNTSTLLGSEDTANTGLSLDTTYFLRIKVSNTPSGGMTKNFLATLQANVNGGTFFGVTTSSTNVRALAGQDDDGDACDTERLTNDGGTFSTLGTYEESGIAPQITTAVDTEVEFCFVITFRSADLTAGSEQIDFKLLNDEDELDNLDVTPEATMPAAGGITELPGAGSLALTGLVPTVIQTFSIDVPVGSLTLTGLIPTAITPADITIPVGVGSLTLTGQVPTVQVGITIAVPVGSLTLTGFAPTVIQTFSVAPGVGTLVLTGQIPTLVQTANQIRAPPLGTAVFSGSIPTVNITQSIPIPVGSGVFTGFAPTVIQTFSVGIPLGSLTLTGFTPTVIQTFSVPVPLGTAVFSGSVPTLNITTTVVVPVGSAVFDGKVPTVVQTFSVDVPVGSGVFSGFTPTVFREDTVSPGVGSLSLTGQVPTVVISAAAITVTPGVGSLSLTGQTPTAIQGLSVALPVGNLVLSGFAPTVVQTFSIDVPVGAGVFSGLAPTVDIDQPIGVPVGSGVFTGFAPTLVQTFSIDVPVGSLSLTGLVPTTVQTFSIPIPVGSLTLTGQAPSLDLGIMVDVGALAVTGFIPTILVTITARPGLGLLTLRGEKPAVDSGIGAALIDSLADGVLESRLAFNFEDLGIRLVQETWVSGVAFNDARQAIINNFVSAGAESGGWNNEVRDRLSVSAISRVSDTQIRIDFNGFSGYSISVNETITVTVPKVALSGNLDIIATPAFTVTADLQEGTEIVNVDSTTEVPVNYEICDRSGFRVYPDELVKDSYGFLTRKESKDERHPQDSLRSRGGDKEKGPQSPELDDQFLDPNQVKGEDL